MKKLDPLNTGYISWIICYDMKRKRYAQEISS